MMEKKNARKGRRKLNSTIEKWDRDFASWRGDKALFWAGRMASTIDKLTVSYPIEISDILELLVYAKNRYNEEIISRMSV